MSLSPASQRVQAALHQAGVKCIVKELSASTRTAKDAAVAIGCDVAQIAKSLVFRLTETGSALLVITSGINRVNEKKVAELVGEEIAKADADFVRVQTGYAIGGIPPVGHVSQLRTLIDQDLLKLEELWAAAGTPCSVFRLTPQELVQISGGTVAPVC